MKKLLIGLLTFSTLSGMTSNSFADCGLSGSIEERINNCAREKLGWQLVTLTSSGKEVWKSPSGVYWGDRLPPRRMKNTHQGRGGTKQYDAEVDCKVNDRDENGSGLPGITFMLPTRKDFMRAEKEQFQQVLPNMDFWFWSSTQRDLGLLANDNYHFGFNGKYGGLDVEHSWMDFHQAARCVGRN